MTLRSLARVTILVADDNDLLRRGLKEMLSLWGISRVATAADGMEAKTVLCRGGIDLVVADWVMGPVDGAGLLRWIRHAPDSPCHDLPVIVLTARADVPTVRAAWDAGADAVLAKPASAVVIARRIEAVLRRPPRTAAHRARYAEPPGDDTRFPHLAPETRATPAGGHRPDGTLHLPTPGASPTDRERRLRLLIVLDRLKAMLDKPGVTAAALRVVAADLQYGTLGDAAMEEIARSFARCVSKVDPFVPVFLDALRAHHAGLRWLAVRDRETLSADASLVVCLSASVDSLVKRHPIVEGIAWEEPEAPAPPAAHG
ncbi:MAG TPA: response regulator [Azospirillum sp.]|nr:response regulator [Azospirillum sp.]